MNKKQLEHGKWQRVFDFDIRTRKFFTITTNNYIIALSGGSVLVSDRNTEDILFMKKGFKYLYTADVSPDEKVLIALENGKHFYAFSLESFTQLKRITLPKGYESTDCYPSFTPCGNEILIPVSRYFIKDEMAEYHYYICRYDAHTYMLISMAEVNHDSFPSWPIQL